MSAEVFEAPTDDVQAESTLEQKAHALHIKCLPYEIWCRARHNANLSRMTFRDYVIRVLTESQPFPGQADPSPAQDGDVSKSRSLASITGLPPPTGILASLSGDGPLRNAIVCPSGEKLPHSPPSVPGTAWPSN